MRALATTKTWEIVGWEKRGTQLQAQNGILTREKMNSRPPFATDEARWQAIVERAPEADGRFFYGVATTGIYCRPVCASRLPNRENVHFFDAQQAAETAGYRPCKRCNPRAEGEADPAVKAIVEACRLIDEAERPPSLEELAGAVGLSKYHFHRLFKKIVGVTPRQYAAEKRADRVRRQLQQGSAVTDAIYNAGFESSSRFYETAASSLGMKPSDYLKGGPGMSIQYATVQSYLGWVLVAATDKGICKIDIGETPGDLQERLHDSFPQADLAAGDAQFEGTVSQVLTFLERPQRGLSLPLDIQGTAFQQRVWSALQQIPPGSTASYAQVAAQIGKPTASRAVASACAANTIAVAIPCHRVVRSDGGLGGYRWGLARKQVLLDREAE